MSSIVTIDILSLNAFKTNCSQVKQGHNKEKGSGKMNQIQTENMPKIEMAMDFKSSKFDDLFLEALDCTFLKLLGINAKQAFFSFLDQKYTLSKEDIPNRIGDLADGLEQIFGASATLLELEVMKNLKKRVPSFNYLAKRPEISFEAYAESLKRQIANL